MLSFSQIFTVVFPYVIGGMGGAVTLFITGFVKEFFSERNRRQKHKLNVARHLLTVCNEASAVSFQKPPRSQEHINSVLTDVKGISNSASEDFERMIGRWWIISGLPGIRKELTIEDIQFLSEMREEADARREKLIAWANKIRY